MRISPTTLRVTNGLDVSGSIVAEISWNTNMSFAFRTVPLFNGAKAHEHAAAFNERRQKNDARKILISCPTFEFTGPARLFAQVRWNDGLGGNRSSVLLPVIFRV
jgi:hypothetical protein